jgi:hypothetical protein
MPGRWKNMTNPQDLRIVFWVPESGERIHCDILK